MRSMDNHNTDYAAYRCKYKKKEGHIMTSLISIILSFLVSMSGVFCKFLPPGIPCFMFLGEPDFSELHDFYENEDN